MSLFPVLVLSVLFFSAPVYATDTKESALQQMLADDPDFASELVRDFAEFEMEKSSEFSAFREERDADFAEFLKEQWDDFSEFPGLIKDSKPKPKAMPKAFDVPRDAPLPPAAVELPVVLLPPPVAPVPAPIPDEQPLPEPALEPVSEPVISNRPVPIPQPLPDPVVSKPETPAPELLPELPVTGRKVAVNYFGHPLVFSIDPQLLGNVGIINNQGVSRFWGKASDADYRPLLAQLATVRQQLALNDWGQYLLLQKLLAEMTADENEAVLLGWFLLNKNSLRARVGFSSGRAFLLAPSGNKIYGVPFYQLDGERYYNLSFLQNGIQSGSIKSYRRDYPGVDSSIGFDLRVTPELPQAEQTKVLSFTYKNKTHQLRTKINLNLIAFYKDYPDTDMKVFFSASVDSDAAVSLAEGLRPIIAGQTETEAANILLRFVQTAFEYKTDDDQFGGEKYMFAAETLYYPYSDCEDRAILYSYLVRELLQLKVVGLIYPGHAATAVRFNQPVGGDQVEIDGERYLVCDPTYINADIGMAMPKFKQAKAEVVVIRNY